MSKLSILDKKYVLSYDMKVGFAILHPLKKFEGETTSNVAHPMIQSGHREQLDGLRRAGHEALTVVVEEYRASLAATVQAQLESCQRSLARSVREETEHLRGLLVEQVLV